MADGSSTTDLGLTTQDLGLTPPPNTDKAPQPALDQESALLEKLGQYVDPVGDKSNDNSLDDLKETTERNDNAELITARAELTALAEREPVKLERGYISKEAFPPAAKEIASNIETQYQEAWKAFAEKQNGKPITGIPPILLKHNFVQSELSKLVRENNLMQAGVTEWYRDTVRPWITSEIDTAERQNIAVLLENIEDPELKNRLKITYLEPSGEGDIEEVNTLLKNPDHAILGHSTRHGEKVLQLGHLASRSAQERMTGSSTFNTGEAKRADQETDQICFSGGFASLYGLSEREEGETFLSISIPGITITKPDVSFFSADGTHLFQPGGFDLDLTTDEIPYALVTTENAYKRLTTEQTRRRPSWTARLREKALQEGKTSTIPPMLTSERIQLLNDHMLKDDTGEPVFLDKGLALKKDLSNAEYTTGMRQRIADSFMEQQGAAETQKGFFMPTGDYGDLPSGDKFFTYKWAWVE